MKYDGLEVEREAAQRDVTQSDLLHDGQRLSRKVERQTSSNATTEPRVSRFLMAASTARVGSYRSKSK